MLSLSVFSRPGLGTDAQDNLSRSEGSQFDAFSKNKIFEIPPSSACPPPLIIDGRRE